MNKLMSDQIDQLATALSKAQAEMSVAGKNQKNPFFKSNYADVESIIQASRPALSKYGLSVIQSPSINEQGESFLVTLLMHSSGQWIKSVARHNPAKADVQSLSSYNTYLKRMCYTSLVGVVVGEHDDDGNAASQAPQSTYNESSYANATADRRSSYVVPTIELVSKDQLEQLEDLLMGHADVCQSVLKGLDIDTLSAMPKNKFITSFKRIQEIISNKGQ